jgi:3-hydroxyacyl-CoA dehydrogenase
MADLAGLDIGWSPETSTGATVRERLCDAGRRGQKSGAGFYDYDDQRRPRPSSQALSIIRAFAEDNQIQQRQISDEEILDRLLRPMAEEGAKLLAEGISLRESDIDVVWVNGYGWPAWTGGPMFHARKARLADASRRVEAAGIDAE